MDLAHAAFLAAQPLEIAVTELGIAITVIRVLLAVFLPEQLLGDLLLFELNVGVGEIGFDKPSLPGTGLGREQQPTQVPLIHAVWQGPLKLGLIGSLQVIHDRAIANIECLGDIAVTEFGFVAKPQDVLDFTH